MRVGVGAAVVLLIVAAVVAVLVSATVQQGSTVGLATGAATPPAVGSSGVPTGVASSGSLLVHVTGAVRKPGLVSLPAGARVVDAVGRAGGLADDADPAGVNLARPVADGEQLVVPRVGEGATGAGRVRAAGPAADRVRPVWPSAPW